MQLRKIETRAEKEKRQRRNQTIVGIILVVVMVLSTAGFAIKQEKEEKIIYRGFTFLKTENGWQLQKQPFSLLTRYHPREVESVSFHGFVSANDFANKQAYFVAFSSNERFAAAEILRNLPVFRAQAVCLEGDENKTGCEDLPIKNCYDDNIIVLKEIRTSNKTSEEENKNLNNETSDEADKNLNNLNATVRKEYKCSFIEADSQEMIKAADRFLFAAYGIIP